VMVADRPGACLRTLVSASCTMRYAARPSASGAAAGPGSPNWAWPAWPGAASGGACGGAGPGCPPAWCPRPARGAPEAAAGGGAPGHVPGSVGHGARGRHRISWCEQ
jgi:hypothetical protein